MATHEQLFEISFNSAALIAACNMAGSSTVTREMAWAALFNSFSSLQSPFFMLIFQIVV
jgi:hypothetical protein